MPTKQLTRKDFAQPKDVSAAQRAFPAQVIGAYLPPQEWFDEDNVPTAWLSFASHIFMGTAGGLPGVSNIELGRKDGVGAEKAWGHATMCLGSFEPKHEHKLAGVAWLLWNWFGVGRYTYGDRTVELPHE